jgi:hypothetical protein
MDNNKTRAVVRRRSVAVAAAIFAVLAVPAATLGQQPESVVVDVGSCVKLTSPGERLDCYEEQVQRARAAAPVSPAPPAAQPPPAAAPPASPATAPQAQAPQALAPPAPARQVVTPPAPAPQAVAAPAPAAPAGSPGAQASERPVRVENARVRRRESPDASEEFEGVITALRETVPNAWVVTLDNGQVWRQDYPEPYRLQVGQSVQISESRGFGRGYRLTVAALGGSIQVERVR